MYALTDMGKTREYEVCVIGGGLLGCMAARNLRHRGVGTLLIERREDVCTGISRANTAIVYPGYDNKPGTLKSRLCVQGNREFGSLCSELGVGFRRCGSLLLCFGPKGESALGEKLRQGQAAGVPGLRLISGAEARTLEPRLSEAVRAALYCPTTGTVNPWELGIAAYENALQNGGEAALNTELIGITRKNNGYALALKSGGAEEKIYCKGILNCAGADADKVYELLLPPRIRLRFDGGDYLVTDKSAGELLGRVIFCEAEDGKGLTAVPTTEGNLLIGGAQREISPEGGTATEPAGLRELKAQLAALLPGCDTQAHVIRSFGALRPNPYELVPDGSGGWAESGRSINSFVVAQSADAPGFVSLMGIKTPGLTCCDTLTRYAVERLLEELGGEYPVKADFDPNRAAPLRLSELSESELSALLREKTEYRKIVCRCGKISEGEVLDAIHRGAVTVDGVKRRCGTGMGECQGARCNQEIMELLSRELGRSAAELTKDGGGTYIVKAALP